MGEFSLEGQTSNSGVADVKLGRCAVGIKMHVEFKDGCDTNTQ